MKNDQVTGRVIKGIGGFYYVHDETDRIFECRAKGIFRSKKQKPLVGDRVVIDVISKEQKTGNLVEILPRSMELIRPACANVDQAIVIFAARDPDPNYILLDKFLIMMNRLELPVILCFNKVDLISDEEMERLRHIYQNACRLHFISIHEEKGLSELEKCLEGRTSVLAGPSGAGKSSFLNYFCPDSEAETGAVSEKIGRGRHTTRHAELFYVRENTYLMDTPGFSSMDLMGLDYRELRYYYPEFDEHEGSCRFQGCVHVPEPDCSVKAAVERGEISRERYDSYCYLYEELKAGRKNF
ncbi:MAG: ribosome small subunit-dependent GTPase A [Lachnospiraceae bacterium]|nr:ribosome small subunit-dependent GTPase A [Lachnospiraceae bacterium]